MASLASPTTYSEPAMQTTSSGPEFLMAIFAAAVALTIIQSTAAGAGTVALELKADIVGKGCQGVAKYIEEEKTDIKFGVAVQNATPGATLGVVVRSKTNHQKIGKMVVNKAGEAYMKIDSRTQKLPQCRSGDLVDIWQRGALVASGKLLR